MSQIADTSAHADVIRNQQVRGSSPRAGSTEQKTYSLVTFSARWQGAYRVAYRRLLAFFGYTPGSRLQPLTDDLDTSERTNELTRRLRG